MRRVLVVAVAGAGDDVRLAFASSLEQSLAAHSWQVSSCRVIADPDGGVSRVLAATRRMLFDGPSPTLILLADERRQYRLVWALVVAGLRPGLRLVLQVRAAAVPLDASLAALFTLADLVVAESGVGVQAVRQCLAEGSVASTPPIVGIPQATMPTGSSATVVEARARGRRSTFGLEAEDLLVGCLAGSGDDHRQLLAMRIFRSFADRLHAGESRPRARLYLAQPRPASGRIDRGWYSARVRQLKGPAQDVLLEGDDLPPIDSERVLIERLSCLDVHLLPHHLADVEPILLTSCALGVAAVTTRFGAAEELLDGAARLVAPAITLDDSAGHRVAIMDESAAVRELLRLATDAGTRFALGTRAREVMQAHDHRGVVDRWVGQIERVAAQ